VIQQLERDHNRLDGIEPTNRGGPTSPKAAIAKKDHAKAIKTAMKVTSFKY
jgi:hypothetical protein